MKVTTIQGNYHNNSFTGLWGDTKTIKESRKTKWCSDIYDYENKEYHPFADESLEALSNIQKKNSTYKTSKMTDIKDCFVHTGTNICIKSSLLFTAKQWMNYISHKMAAGCPEFNIIENNLRKLHLERYLR